MSELPSTVTFDTIVSNAILELGEDGHSGLRLPFAQFAIRIFKNDLQLFYLPSVVTKKIEVSDNDTITLPPEFVKFVALGIPDNVRFWSFTYEGKILIPLGEDCGDEVLNEDDQEDEDMPETKNYGGYAAPGGQNLAYYKLDVKNNRIILKNYHGTHVRLKYISTGISLDGDTEIPMIAEEAMIAGVHYLYKRFNRRFNGLERKEAKDEFNNACRKLRFAKRPTVDEIYDTIYKTFYQGPKR